MVNTEWSERGEVAGPSLLCLGRWVLDAPENLPISAKRRERLQAAMEGVRTALAFEDKFAMLADNLVEFEFGLLRISSAKMVGTRHTHDGFFEQKRELNRHLTNLLSTTRQYLDQNHKHIEPLLGGTDVSFKKLTNKEYDSSLGYRVMELLRNYVQHRNLGVHTMSVDSTWLNVQDDRERKLRYRTTAFLDLDFLSLDDDFTQKEREVIGELRSQPIESDIPMLAREYVAALSRIHKATREALKPKIDDWKGEVKAAFADYTATFPTVPMAGLCVMWRHPDRTATKVLDIFSEPIDRLEKTETHTLCPINLGRAHVSSEYVPTRRKK